jgi:spore coat polysaccharide biosynthesis protein SpsF
MSTIAIIQARMSSTRLPGKVLKPLGNSTVVDFLFRQLQYSRRITQVVLATSTDSRDEALYNWACDSLVACYRGSLDNVLDRFYHAAVSVGAKSGDIIVRITGDCPLIDSVIVDAVIDMHQKKHVDYASNINPPTFPDGFDCEVFTFDALKYAFENATLLSEHEHVTPYIRNHHDIFSQANYYSAVDYSQYRLTLDTPEDYLLISGIVDLLLKEYPNSSHRVEYVPIATLEKVCSILERFPVLLQHNQHFQRNEGYQRSLLQDLIT